MGHVAVTETCRSFLQPSLFFLCVYPQCFCWVHPSTACCRSLSVWLQECIANYRMRSDNKFLNVFIHELAHADAQLADEYTYGVDSPNQYKFANCHWSSTEAVPWRHWIDRKVDATCDSPGFLLVESKKPLSGALRCTHPLKHQRSKMSKLLLMPKDGVRSHPLPPSAWDQEVGGKLGAAKCMLFHFWVAVLLCPICDSPRG